MKGKNVAGNSKPKSESFLEECLVYHSNSDNCWVAHGLHTDQIGTGDCMLNAYADYLTGIENLKALQQEQKNIRIWRIAPADILRRAEKAQLLPKELYEVAHKKVHGTWPKYLKIIAQSSGNHAIKVKIKELVQAYMQDGARISELVQTCAQE